MTAIKQKRLISYLLSIKAVLYNSWRIRHSYSNLCKISIFFLPLPLVLPLPLPLPLPFLSSFLFIYFLRFPKFEETSGMKSCFWIFTELITRGHRILTLVTFPIFKAVWAYSSFEKSLLTSDWRLLSLFTISITKCIGLELKRKLRNNNIEKQC